MIYVNPRLHYSAPGRNLDLQCTCQSVFGFYLHFHQIVLRPFGLVYRSPTLNYYAQRPQGIRKARQGQEAQPRNLGLEVPLGQRLGGRIREARTGVHHPLQSVVRKVSPGQSLIISTLASCLPSLRPTTTSNSVLCLP
jgi:hypothetical protein